ncbi:MAG: hypothetical protein OEW68_08595 [Gammaproteobacteria bacterium]|nr:hypothetical protein [Gammaproteobacteria bacterium]MDH4314884.1 hypothetical protein [Gammaproteobacteria bacterium]MDH5213796.1 hypothetical protein [Gammaproteobacteria bacterium]MDH5500031.1 hypothetical protein [Gammaproteobacteria bacterium]
MANDSYGSAKVGMKTVELRGFTGTVSGVSKSSYTQTHVDHQNRTSSTSTTNYTEFRLNAPDGSLQQLEVESKYARVNDGDVATAFWGNVGGKDRNYYLAVYNHKLGELGIIPSERNRLAGPVGHAFLIIVAVFAGVFGVFGVLGGSFAGMIGVGIAGGVWWIIKQRRKTLLDLVDSGVAQVKSGGRKAPQPMHTGAAIQT